MVNNGCKLGRQKMEQLLWRQNHPNSQADWGELGGAWNSLCMLWRGSWLRHVVELHHDFGCPPCWARMASWQLKIDWKVVYEPRALLALRLSLPQSHFLFWPCGTLSSANNSSRERLTFHASASLGDLPNGVQLHKSGCWIGGYLVELLVSYVFTWFHNISQYLLIAFWHSST